MIIYIYIYNTSRRDPTILFLFKRHMLYWTVKKTPWPQSASELYRPSDRRLSAKLVPTFADIRRKILYEEIENTTKFA
jgi:hypothetical protein